jgi:hypothetical protein
LSVTDIKALPLVQERLAEARAQLRDYRRTLEAVYGDRLRLRTYVVVALGFERLVSVSNLVEEEVAGNGI